MLGSWHKFKIMVNIQPVQLFTNYGPANATKLNLIVIEDDLKSFAKFQYFLCDANEISLYSNNLTMNEPDYTNWNNDTDINAAAYTWAAAELGLTIIP